MMWQWIGKIGKHVSRVIAVLLLAMALLAFVPGPIGKWGWNFWLSVDQFANTLTLGDPDETISSRLGKWITEDGVDPVRKAWGHTVCFFLEFVDTDHCVASIDPHVGGDAVIK